MGLVVGASFVGKAAAPITAIPNSRGFFLHHVVFASFAILAVLSIMLLPESQGQQGAGWSCWWQAGAGTS